jgi:hypothetical protein
MMSRRDLRPLCLVAVIAAMLSSLPALAQAPDAPADQATDQPAAPPEGGGVYKPPLRGAPGGRVGGASRGAIRSAIPLPTIELIAPLDHTGDTASATPVLYFYVSQPVALPTQFTISQPLVAKPVLEVTFASPPARGLYALRLADYHVQLEPGIAYTWSVSAIVDPKTWSRNVVASATIERVTPEASLASALTASPARRVALLAGAGLWYDAVAAAAEAENLDRHAALDELLTEVGLSEPARADRAAAGTAPAAR